MAFTRTDHVNARTCSVFARVSIALISLNLPCWQFLLQSSCWLELAWLFVSLNLPINTGSLSCCTTAAWTQLQSRLQSTLKYNLNLLQNFKFKFTCMMIPIILNFNLSLNARVSIALTSLTGNLPGWQFQLPDSTLAVWPGAAAQRLA